MLGSAPPAASGRGRNATPALAAEASRR